MTIELRGINEMLSVGIKIVNTTGQDYLLLNCLPSLSSFINTVPCPLRPSNSRISRRQRQELHKAGRIGTPRIIQHHQLNRNEEKLS